MKNALRPATAGSLALGALLAVAVLAAEKSSADGRSYSAYAGEQYPMNVYWGDTHVHTNLSADANNFGNRGLTPEDAYRFARGEEIVATNGMPVKLGRSLDFLMVSDHAEFLGLMARIDAEDPQLMQSETLRRWREMRHAGKHLEVIHEWAPYIYGQKKDPLVPPEFTRSLWAEYAATADRYNAPGRFTTFIGYEWSAMPDGNNLHRNVLFLDGAEKVTTVVPFSAIDSPRPEDLWTFMADYEARIGGSVLDIPHNSNMSGGLMFAATDTAGRPLTRAYTTSRARWEPIVEMTQIKGDSESHPYLSADDEFAGFGDWDWSNLSGSVAHQNAWFEGEYARAALKTGLRLENELGVNPFKFGMIGSTDSHTALSTTEENNWFGKTSDREPAADRAGRPWLSVATEHQAKPTSKALSAGYAAVWATENTRSALFAAMKRKEVYATTGTRILVRFFGGWNFEADDARRPELARTGYRKGVPMGGDLPAAPASGAPTFLILAMKDPDGANLDRVQVIKGWLNAKGELHERIHDVAVAGDRKVGADGRVRTPVGNTVDVKAASYTNAIGARELTTVWRDPAFDPSESAFYYLRVIEIPTPRWPAYDAKFFGTEPPADTVLIEQDRAYTSPIWYTPAGAKVSAAPR